MRTLSFIAVLVSFAAPVFAHGDASHPTCKKGYVVTDNHKCVKTP
jgi:hypothetical protein